MNFLRKMSLTVLAVCFFASFSTFAFAQDTGGTVLPDTEKKVSECEVIMFHVDINFKEAKTAVAKREDFTVLGLEIKNVSGNDILACGIKTGDIKMWMIPFYIRFVLEFIIGLAGLVAVGGVVYGGYLYLFAGLSDDKDKGKNAIKNGVIGLVLTLTAWAFVSIIISLVS